MSPTRYPVIVFGRNLSLWGGEPSKISYQFLEIAFQFGLNEQLIHNTDLILGDILFQKRLEAITQEVMTIVGQHNNAELWLINAIHCLCRPKSCRSPYKRGILCFHALPPACRVADIDIQLTDFLWIPVDGQRTHEIVVPAGIVGSEKFE
jgi:hypothetical protein